MKVNIDGIEPMSEEKPLPVTVFSSSEWVQLQAYWARRLAGLMRDALVPTLAEPRRLVLIGQIEECKRNLNLFRVMHSQESEDGPLRTADR